MTDFDAWICSQELGFVLKSEQREALELLLRGKDVFCVLPTGFDKSLIYQMWFMQRVRQVLFNGRPSLLSCLAKKGGLLILRKNPTVLQSRCKTARTYCISDIAQKNNNC